MRLLCAILAAVVEHCTNYDPFYEGCIACPGKFTVKMPDGEVKTICSAGEAAMRRIVVTVDNGAPVYPVLFPAPEKKQ